MRHELAHLGGGAHALATQILGRIDELVDARSGPEQHAEVADWDRLLKLAPASLANEQSVDRMVIEAEELGVNAISAARFTTSVIIGGAAELPAVSTAVVVEDN